MTKDSTTIESSSRFGSAYQSFGPSEAELRTFIDTIPVIAWCSPPDGSGEFWNRRWHDYTGLSTEAARNWTWRNLIHADDLDELERKWLTDCTSGRAGSVEGRLRRFDGEYRRFLFHYAPLGDETGKIVTWYGTGTDIEDFKRAQQSQEEFYRITDFIPHAITVLSADGTVLHANRVALEQTGLTLDEVKKRSFFLTAFHPEDIETLRAKRDAGLASGEPFELDLRQIRKSNGEHQWCLVRYRPMKDEHGRLIRWYVTGTDIQKQKKVEERLRNENVALREEIESSMFEEIVGASESMREVLKQVAKVASSDSTVLILGETGTGKELIARALHRRSERADKPFIRVNCAAIPQSLIASELFGHEKGSFTGALQRRVGRFEAAHGGTLFLDEVGDLPAETQIALLRVLQEREIERIGSNHPISVDVRLIAATNRDLSDAVSSGAFREDLFYRLNVFPIALPPLRDRVADIPLLLEYFVGRLAKKAGKKINHVNRHTLAMFKAYEWPGNIRELQNVVERGVILTEEDTFSVDDNWFKSRRTDAITELDGLPGLAKREVEMIKTALAQSDGRIGGSSGAAAKLKVPRQTLESKIRRFGIDEYLQNIRSAK